MSARERIIKGEKVELSAHLARSWALFADALPSVSALQLGASLASLLSFCLEYACPDAEPRLWECCWPKRRTSWLARSGTSTCGTC